MELLVPESVDVNAVEAIGLIDVDLAFSMKMDTVEEIGLADAVLVRLAQAIQERKAALKPMRDSTTKAW